MIMINDHLPAGSKLPIDPQDDIRSFYEIMRGKLRVTERNILLYVNIPLVSIAEFQVFRNIPKELRNKTTLNIVCATKSTQ